MRDPAGLSNGPTDNPDFSRYPPSFTRVPRRIYKSKFLFPQTEPTPLEGKGLVSLNAFGFGGSNAHVILLPNENEEQNFEVDVFFMNGRTSTAVSSLIDLAVREPKKGWF